jgi:hypothetical protein
VLEWFLKNGKPIGYSAYNPNTGNNILMKLEELSIFKASVENNLGYNIENTPNHQSLKTFCGNLFELGNRKCVGLCH